jgi:hypothetical protein
MIKPISLTGSGRPRLRTAAAAAYLGIGKSTLEKTSRTSPIGALLRI